MHDWLQVCTHGTLLCGGHREASFGLPLCAPRSRASREASSCAEDSEMPQTVQRRGGITQENDIDGQRLSSNWMRLQSDLDNGPSHDKGCMVVVDLPVFSHASTT